jgi:hypothetical protein
LSTSAQVDKLIQFSGQHGFWAASGAVDKLSFMRMVRCPDALFPGPFEL